MYIQDHSYGISNVSDCKPNTKCYKPLRIFNRYLNEVLYVPCRKCPACLSARSTDLTSRLVQETKQHLFAIFFTLTYDNDHVPRLVKLCPHVYRLNRDYNDYGIKDKFLFTTKSFNELGVHHLTHLDGDTFGVVCKRDVQLFLKRVRRKIDYKYKDTISDYERKIRYFIASEYGSVYQRPHYHGIIFCDNRQLAYDLENIIRSAWLFCSASRIDVQFISGSAPQYVAKYLNGCAHLPKVLQSKPFRTFYICSKNPVIGSFRNSFKEVQDALINGLVQKACVRNQERSDIAFDVLPYSVVSRYLPKCQGFSVSDDNYKLSLFDKYEQKRYIKHYDSIKHCYIESGLRGFDYIDTYGFKYADYRFYKAIKRFCCCSSVPLRSSDGRIIRYIDIKMSPNEVIHRVTRLYQEYDYLRLCSQLRTEEVLSKTSNSFTLLSFYPLLWRELPYTMTMDDFIMKSPFDFGNSYAFVFMTFFNLKYDDIYENNVIKDSFIHTMNNLPIDIGYRDSLIRTIYEADSKKKFNELYNNFNV